MSKRLLPFTFAVFLLLGLFFCGVLATGTIENPEIIMFKDGSYVKIFIEGTLARVANTVSGYKQYVFHDGVVM